MQYKYGDDVPTRNYKVFAEIAGCTGGSHSSVLLFV
jgi:RNase adaptor protein for sRNA GlmZ degradation